MTKFGKVSTIIFVVVAILGTKGGWLPGIWACTFAFAAAYGIDRWIKEGS